MYAITATGYRTVTETTPLNPGETRVETLPQALIDSIKAAESSSKTNYKALQQQADAALSDLRAYRDTAAPTNAQTIAIVKVLCRVAIGLIRLNLSKLDGTG